MNEADKDAQFRKDLYKAVTEVFDKYDMPPLGEPVKLKGYGAHTTDIFRGSINRDVEELIIEACVDYDYGSEICPSEILTDNEEDILKNKFWDYFKQGGDGVYQIAPVPRSLIEPQPLRNKSDEASALHQMLEAYGVRWLAAYEDNREVRNLFVIYDFKNIDESTHFKLYSSYGSYEKEAIAIVQVLNYRHQEENDKHEAVTTLAIEKSKEGCKNDN